jgi:cation:H+ antiporter
MLFLSFLASLTAILIVCVFFSNSVEWLGEKLNLSHGVTGSILAAVGTALPETIVPLVAIFWGVNNAELKDIILGNHTLSSSSEISLGAIIGAPFMLATLAFFLIGLSSYTYFKSGRRKSIEIKVDKTVLNRDLTFFLISYSLAFLAVFINPHWVHVLFAVVLLLMYGLYLYLTITEESNSNYKGEELEENLDPFLLGKIFKKHENNPSLFLIWVQLILSLLMLLFTAHFFVDVIKDVSHHLSFPAFVISLLLTPLATELPEKFNSWMWIRQRKDTLAVGNISGALVFQSTFPVSIGLLFTTWQVKSILSYATFVFCIINTLIILIALKQNKLNYKTFLFCGIAYLIYLVLVFGEIR